MTSDLLDTMRARLSEAESAADRLRQAIAVIEGGNGNTANPRRREATKKPVASPPEPAKMVPLGKLISALKTEPGQSASRLAKSSGGNQPASLALLKEAETAGKVRREGERRGTVWFVITADESKAAAKAADEEKVAAKTAEIEARTNKPPRKRAPLPRARKTETASRSVEDEIPAATASEKAPQNNSSPGLAETPA